MINSDRKYIHWDYYLTIEDDLKTIARYIDFCEINFSTYSIELARILQITCSEVDVVSKLLCKKLDSSKNYKDINDYKNQILKSIPSITEEKIYSKRYGLILNPFTNWSNNIQPDWWTGYNLVKHTRNNNFHLANLKNVLNAVVGLQIITIYYYLIERNGEFNNSEIINIFYDISNNSEKSEVFTFNDNNYYKNLVIKA